MNQASGAEGEDGSVLSGSDAGASQGKMWSSLMERNKDTNTLKQENEVLKNENEILKQKISELEAKFGVAGT